MDKGEAYEQLDLFYLGREKNLQGQDTQTPFLYKNKQLTTHAAIIGMTGSGKTGLGISLLEEAALDGIPALVIDPKGDMANLLLTFPELRPEDFAPWVDPAIAEQKKISVDELAVQTAATWKKGLADWQENGDRIRRLQESAEFAIYTPGSSAGRMVSILESMEAPSKEMLAEQETVTELVNATVSSLLGLLGIEADPMKSREHVLLSTILLDFWRKGQDVRLETLISSVAQPPFSQVGVFPVDSFYPQAKRMELAMQINTLLASPSFSSWMQGEPLRIENFLYTAKGKPRISIFSIAHLSDGERMFFVTLLLGRLINWMRRQEGSNGLRCLFYMDEIFGFFPPTANPPSKEPMLLLLKQARAFGLGIVLSTQNPVDLDYKGLSNIGSWFIGRLQTRQDQDRVLSGIAGSSKTMNKEELRALIGNLKERTFLLQSAHLSEPVLFSSRWAMSYLKGPISLAEISKLDPPGERDAADEAGGTPDQLRLDKSLCLTLPAISGGILQYFVPSPMPGAKQEYKAVFLGLASVRTVDQRRSIDATTDIHLVIPLQEDEDLVDWSKADAFTIAVENLVKAPPSAALFEDIPAGLKVRKDLSREEKQLSEYLYRSKSLNLFKVKALNLESAPNETEQAFRQRVASALAAKKDEIVAQLEEEYEKKHGQLEKKLSLVQAKLSKESSDVQAKGIETVVSFGSALLGAFLGKKVLSTTNANKSMRGIRNVGQLAKERQDVQRVEEEMAAVSSELEALSAELQAKIGEQSANWDPQGVQVENIGISPRKSDIFNVRVCLLWEPAMNFSLNKVPAVKES